VSEIEIESRYIRLTRRMCVELRVAFGQAKYDGSRYEWDKVQETLEGGANSKSGTRLDLNYFPVGASEHLLVLLKLVEAGTFHKQAGDALRARIAILNDHLGVSAVDRLGELM
jgi:hypothetical protein